MIVNVRILFFRGLPVDPNLPATPADGGYCDKGTLYSEYCLLLLAAWMGEPLAYADEKNGAIIHNICPVRGSETRQENTGSTVLLEAHTEQGFHVNRPDYLGLCGLRADHENRAITATASVRRAIRRLPNRVVDMLRRPAYRLRVSSSFTCGSGPMMYSNPLPVLTGSWETPHLVVDYYDMEAMDSAAEMAFDLFKQTLMEGCVGVAIQPGGLLLIDNRVAAHARTAFKPLYDGSDRWLQRLYIVSDFRLSEASRRRGSHVCVPLPIEYALSH